MRRTSRLTTTLNLVRLVSKLLCACSIVANLGCAGTPKFPADFLYEYDREYGACGVYKITNFERLEYDFVKDLPLHECPPIFGFTAHDTANVLNWVMDRIKEAKSK